MDLEYFFLLENIATIVIGLVLFIIGFSYRNRLYSEDARRKLMADWRKFSIAIGLFGGSLLIYLVSEFARFIDPFYPDINLHDVHEWGEIIHMFLLMLAMVISAIVALDIGRAER